MLTVEDGVEEWVSPPTNDIIVVRDVENTLGVTVVRPVIVWNVV